MSERRLLAACIASRDAFETIQPHLRKEDISEQGDIIMSSVRDYYQRDPDAQRADPELLVGAISRGLSNPKHKEMFTQLVTSIAGEDVATWGCLCSGSHCLYLCCPEHRIYSVLRCRS